MANKDNKNDVIPLVELDNKKKIEIKKDFIKNDDDDDSNASDDDSNASDDDIEMSVDSLIKLVKDSKGSKGKKDKDKNNKGTVLPNKNDDDDDDDDDDDLSSDDDDDSTTSDTGTKDKISKPITKLEIKQKELDPTLGLSDLDLGLSDIDLELSDLDLELSDIDLDDLLNIDNDIEKTKANELTKGTKPAQSVRERKATIIDKKQAKKKVENDTSDIELDVSDQDDKDEGAKKEKKQDEDSDDEDPNEVAWDEAISDTDLEKLKSQIDSDPNNREKYFLECASVGFLQGMKLFVDSGVSPTCVDNVGDTVVHQAVYGESPAIFDYLFNELGLSADVTNNIYRTPLMDAACVIAVSTKILVDQLEKEEKLNFVIDLRDRYECTALMEAIDTDELASAELLISKGADCLIKNIKNENLFHLAVINEDKGRAFDLIAKSILKNSKKPTSEDQKLLKDLLHQRREDGCMPFHVLQKGVDEPEYENVRILAKYHTRPNEVTVEDLTPLMVAVKKRHLKGINIICECYPKAINATNSVQNTAAMIACQEKADKCLTELLKFKTLDISMRNKLNYTALEIACIIGSIACVKLLMSKNAWKHEIDYDFEDEDDKPERSNALNLACQYGQKDIVIYLINEKKIPLKQEDLEGFQVLHIAAMQQQVSMMKSILDLKPSIELINSMSCLFKIDEQESDAYTPLHLAIFHNHVQIMKVLLASGALVNCKSECDAKTPLMVAVERDHAHMIAILYANGANLHEKTDETKFDTALHIAAHLGHSKSAREILRIMPSKHEIDAAIFRTFNLKGLSPFEVAVKQSNDKTVLVFIEFASEDLLRTSLSQSRSVFHQGASLGDDIKNQKMSKSDEKEAVHTCIPFRVPPRPTSTNNNLHFIIDNKCYRAVNLYMNRLVSFDKEYDEVEITAGYLDVNENSQTPLDDNFDHRKPSLLHKIAASPDAEIKSNNVIDIIVRNKLQYYRLWFLVSGLFYLIFIVAMLFSFIRGSQVCSPSQYNSIIDYFRIATDIIIVLYTIFFILTELFEFWVLWYQVVIKSRNKSKTSSEINLRSGTKITRLYRQSKHKIRLLNKKSYFIVSAFREYFFDAFNLMDIFAILVLIVWMILRGVDHRYQWYLAALAAIVNIIRFYKYTRVIPTLGAYVSTIFRIFQRDIPRFLVLFGIFALSFMAGIHLTIRASIKVPINVTNENCDITYEFFGEPYATSFSLLLNAFLFLNDGGLSDLQSGFDFSNSIFLAFLVLIFGFGIIIILSNILIAQLSETYSTVVSGSELIYRLNLIIQLEQESALFFTFGRYLRRYSMVDSKKVTFEKWYKIDSLTDFKDVDQSLENIEARLKDFDAKSDITSDNTTATQDAISLKLDKMDKMMIKIVAKLEKLEKK